MLNNEKVKVKELNNKIIFYEKNNNENSNKVKQLINILRIKERELNDLKSQLTNNDSLSHIKPGEKIIAINFTLNKEIQKPIACKNTDIIARLEEKIYNEYPKFKDYNNNLAVNGKIIKRFKSLDENGIKDGDTIIVNIIYDE